MATPPRKGELPPPVSGFADPKRRAASTAAYGEQLGRSLGDDVDVHALLDDEPTRPHQIVPHEVAEPPEAPDEPGPRAVLEPVSDDAHPVENRRVPTQPQLLSEALAAVASDTRPTQLELGEGRAVPQAPAVRAVEPKPLAPNRSPSPVPLRVGLFSSDRPTNWLAAAALGLTLSIIPAQQLARARAQELTTQPLLELQDAIDSPLAVDANLLRKPQAIAAEVEAARGEAFQRYLMIWLGVGLGLGLGLGLAPRFWS